MESVSRMAHISRRPTLVIFLKAYNMVLFSSLVILVSCTVSFAVAATYVFQDDCAKYPGSCNNDCYAIFAAGVSDVPTGLRKCP